VWKKSSLLETARWVDGKQHLQERLSTALEFSDSSTVGAWKALVVQDAARHAGEVDPRKLSPIRLTKVGRWALLVVVLSAGLGFVPEYRSKQFVLKQRDAANIRGTGKHLAEFTRRNLEQRPPVLEPTQKALETVADMGDKLGRANLTRTEALRDL